MYFFLFVILLMSRKPKTQAQLSPKNPQNEQQNNAVVFPTPQEIARLTLTQLHSKANENVSCSALHQERRRKYVTITSGSSDESSSDSSIDIFCWNFGKGKTTPT